jgi:hypothetical protein
MKRALFLLALVPSLWAGTSLTLPAEKTGTASLSCQAGETCSGTSFTNAASFRIEFRAKNLTRATSGNPYAYVVQVPNVMHFVLQRPDYGTNAGCLTGPGSAMREDNIPETMDIEVRMQRVVTSAGSGYYTCEIWNIEPADGPALLTSLRVPTSGTTTMSAVPSGTVTIGPNCTPGAVCGGAAGYGVDLAYLRIFSTAVDMGSIPPAASVKGDLFNYEFTGSTTAELGADDHVGPGATARNITWDADVTGCGGGTAPCTVTTPTYGPVCDAGDTQVFRTGTRITADASDTYARNLEDSGAITYAWNLDEFPAGSNPLFVDNDTDDVTVSVENTVFGQYVLRAKVTDSASLESTSCTVTHGAVAYNSDGIVIYPPDTPDAVEAIVGPLIAPGMSPTSWMDTAATSSADEFDAIWGTVTNADRKGYWDYDEENWGGGTVTIAQSDTTVSPNPGTKMYCDSGTCDFQGTVCATGSTSPISGATVMVSYPAYQGGGVSAVQGGYASGVVSTNGESGWLYASVASCQSDTEITLSTALNVGAPKGTSFTGRNWSYFTGTPSPILAWSAAGPSAVDFYDTGLAYYAMYYRTGLTKYLTRARYIADRNYTNPVSINKGLPFRHNLNGTYHHTNDGTRQEWRDVNLGSIVIRALETELGDAGRPEFWTGIRYVCDYIDESNSADGAGNREAGYALAFLSMCAMGDPDNTQREAWLTVLDTAIDGFMNTRCDGSTSPYRVCHGRNTNIWVDLTWGQFPPALGGVRSGIYYALGPTHATYSKSNWKVRLTNGSYTAEMINGPLTFPAAHPHHANFPIQFGLDGKLGPLCVGTGTAPNFTCGTTPPTTAYTTGMVISFVPPVAINSTSGLNINVDGLGSKQVLALNDTTFGFTDYRLTANEPVALYYNGTRWQVVPVTAAFYPKLTPDMDASLSDSDDFGRAFYWPEYVDSTHFNIKAFSLSTDRDSVPYEPWTGATGDYEFQLDGTGATGSRVQPFMVGIIMRALFMAHRATVLDGSPNADAATMLSDAAQWIIDYAYDPLTGGLYFARHMAGCELESDYGVMPATIAAIPGGCLSDLGGARGMIAEITGAMSAAYLLETDSTRKAAIRTAMLRYWGHMWGKSGYTCTGEYAAYCDGDYLTLVEETYTSGENQYRVDKYLGFALGFGGIFSWPSADAHTEYPREAPTRTVSISFRLGDVTDADEVRITLKDQHGTELTPVDCDASPCSVTIPDYQAGKYQFKLAYRKAGATVAEGRYQPLANVDE